MKNSILLFLAIALSSFTWPLSSHAAPNLPDNLLRFIATYPGLRDTGLYTLLAARCTRYAPIFEKSKCREAVAQEIHLLDFDIVFENQKSMIPSFVFVAFKTNLIHLLSQEKTSVFLSALETNLQRYFQKDLPHLNIWEMALAHYKSSEEAAKVMAVLFQDTSYAQLHLSFLEKTKVKGNLNFQKNKDQLGYTIDLINRVLDHSESSAQELFYPKEIKETLNRNIYHFYVPLYLSKALMKKGVKKKYAFMAPLMLTLSYEFITAAEDFRYLIWDPKYLSPEEHLWKLKDIYAGYSGVSFGTLGTKAMKRFDHVQESFARSTEDAVHFLLNP